MNTRSLPASPLPTPTHALVVVRSPDEREYHRLRAGIFLRTSQVERLEAEVNPLVAAFETFEREYTSGLGSLQHDLRELRNVITRLRERATRIHARMAADPHGLLGDLFSREELTDIGQMFGIEIPESWFPSEEYEREQARRNDRTWRFFEDGAGADDNGPRQVRDRARPARRSETEEREIRQLYLDLARRFHPDLAATDEQRRECQDMMSRVNTAWHDRDLATLRSISQDMIGDEIGHNRISYQQRCIWAQRECVRLDEQIRHLTGRLAALRASETFPLWFNPALGRSVIDRRVATLRIDIANAHRESDEARDYFRQALRYYAAASPV